MNSKDVFSAYVVFLRAVALVHQNNHWMDNGQVFFAHHLMFERLYQETFDILDTTAEKAVGLFGAETIGFSRQAKPLHDLILKYNNESSSTLESSLAACKDFLKLSKNVYSALKEAGDLSLGLDDLIMSNASTVESHVYLLQQSL